jgi:hypothetical protein
LLNANRLFWEVPEAVVNSDACPGHRAWPGASAWAAAEEHRNTHVRAEGNSNVRYAAADHNLIDAPSLSD